MARSVARLPWQGMNRHALTVATLTALAAPVLAQAPAESPTLCPPGTHAIPEREAVLLNVRPLLVERRWEDLTASLDLLSEAGRFEGSFESQLGLALSRLELPGYDAEIDVWIEAKPESYYPWLVRGMRRVGLAWEARGDGWASSVGEDGWKAFRALLGDARADLERAAELEPGSVWPFVELLSVAMGLSLGERRGRPELLPGAVPTPRRPTTAGSASCWSAGTTSAARSLAWRPGGPTGATAATPGWATGPWPATPTRR